MSFLSSNILFNIVLGRLPGTISFYESSIKLFKEKIEKNPDEDIYSPLVVSNMYKGLCNFLYMHSDQTFHPFEYETVIEEMSKESEVPFIGAYWGETPYGIRCLSKDEETKNILYIEALQLRVDNMNKILNHYKK